MTNRHPRIPERVWLSILMLLLSCLLCGAASRVTARDGAHAAGETGLSPVRSMQSGRTPAAHIGSIMALLATFHEAGALPRESSREADRLIHALIQSQSLFLKSSDPVARDMFVSALSHKFGAQKAASLSRAFAVTGWTSETLEALVDYSASRATGDEPRLENLLREYNVTAADWTLVERVFARAREQLLEQGRHVHAVFAAQRASMPGAR